MKAKYLLIALLGLVIASCSDNSGSLGLGMFPESDQTINGKTTTFEVTTQSAINDDVFAKTSIGYVGRYTDPDFGYYEAGFITQLHCTDEFVFPPVCDLNNADDLANEKAVMIEDKIYRTELVLSYTSYFGDSLTASRMSVYQLNKAIDKNVAYYTDIDPTEFYDPSDLLGRKAYTAVDLSKTDSVRALSTYVPSLTFTLPTEIGQKILEKSRECEKKGISFANDFMDMFKGIYVKSDYGDGCILYIDQVIMNVIYEVYVRDSDTGEILKTYDEAADSTAYSYKTFASTKEIIQANSFKSNQELINKKVMETDCTYLKTPAGIYTQATLPLEEFETKLSEDTLNVVKLAFTNYNKVSNATSAFEMSAPDYVLLVREKDKNEFFIKNKISDDVTSYLAQHNGINTNQYVFSNIAQLVNYCLAEKKAAEEELATYGKIDSVTDENGLPVTTLEQWKEVTQWDKVAVIPVDVDMDSSSNITSVLNDLKPGYTRLKGGPTGGKLELNVTYTSFKK